jgi:PPOX class probable F420-dependent enzyme
MGTVVISRSSGNGPDMETEPLPSDVSGALIALRDVKYLNLESYRRSGKSVRTPIWFAASPGDFANPIMEKLYVYSIADSGKAKRIRRCGRIRIAACDVRGKVTAPWTNAFAEVATAEEFEPGMRLLDRKYLPWKQILNLSAMLFRRRKRIVLVIRLVSITSSR